MPDNHMAVLASEVLREAERALDTADALIAAMEPHLRRRYGNSSIYGYVNAHTVPPGDVLLAAALAAGISIDQKLGIATQQTQVERQVDDLRTEMARLRSEVAELRSERRMPDNDQPDPQAAQADIEAAKRHRAARREEWARHSEASAQPPTPSPSVRPASRRPGK